MAFQKPKIILATGAFAVAIIVAWLALSLAAASDETPALPPPVSGSIGVSGPDGEPIQCANGEDLTVTLDGRGPAGDVGPAAPSQADITQAQELDASPSGKKVADAEINLYPRCDQDGGAEWVPAPADAEPPGAAPPGE